MNQARLVDVPSATTFGRYVLLKRLGSGAMGDVHLARPIDARSPSPLVIKRLHGRLSSHPLSVRRFRHEAELASYVSSPHVARVYDSGVVGDVLYIAMEYIAGWPLSRVIHELTKRAELPTIPAAIRMIEGAVEGLIALHSTVHPESGAPLDIVHRDIAPKNIMVGEDGRSRLIDLGVGRSSARDWKTRTGLTVGTPGYMPPEQVFGDSVDHRADIYAAGVVIFELLTLTPYIERGSLGQMLNASLVVEPRAPSSVRGDIPRALDKVVLKALALRPEDRFAKAEELLAALREAVPRGGSDESAMLIDDLLWRELDAKKTEVLALLTANQTALLATLPSNPVPDTLTAPPVRARSKLARVLPLAVVVGGAGLGIAVADMQRSQHTAPTNEVVPVETSPAATPAAIEKLEPTAIESTKIATPPRRKAAPRSITTKAKESPPPPPVVRTALEITPDALLARATKLRGRFEKGSELEKEADALLREITLGMASGAPSDWSGLARRLDRLEKQ